MIKNAFTKLICVLYRQPTKLYALFRIIYSYYLKSTPILLSFLHVKHRINITIIRIVCVNTYIHLYIFTIQNVRGDCRKFVLILFGCVCLLKNYHRFCFYCVRFEIQKSLIKVQVPLSYYSETAHTSRYQFARGFTPNASYRLT